MEIWFKYHLNKNWTLICEYLMQNKLTKLYNMINNFEMILDKSRIELLCNWEDDISTWRLNKFGTPKVAQKKRFLIVYNKIVIGCKLFLSTDIRFESSSMAAF